MFLITKLVKYMTNTLYSLYNILNEIKRIYNIEVKFLFLFHFYKIFTVLIGEAPAEFILG